VSEYHIETLGDPKVIVLPAPRVLTQKCWDVLLAKVEAGATLVVSGPIEQDEYGRFVPRLAPFHLKSRNVPVSPYEGYESEKTKHLIRYTRDSLQRVEKAVLEGRERVERHVLTHGAGKIYYCPLPLETASEGNLRSLYADALNLPQDSSADGVLHRKSHFAEATLHLFVNDDASPRNEVLQRAIPFGLTLPPKKCAVVLTDRAEKTALAKWEQP
jgi:hypothetical protein